MNTTFTPYNLKAMFYLLFLNEDYRDRFFPILNPDIFIADKELNTLAKAYWLFHEKYDHYPDQFSFIEEVFNQEGRNIELFSHPPTEEATQLLLNYFINNIVGLEPPIPEFITDITIHTIKLINLHKVITKHKTAINEGTVNTDEFAQELLDCTTVTDVTDVGINALEDLDKRTAFRLAHKDALDVVPCNIPELGSMLEDGGVPPGTLSFWLGATGVGKTTALITTSKVAILANKKVLYISAELSMKEIMKRFDSAMTGIPILDIKYKAEATHDAIMASPRYVMAMSNLVVQEVPMGFCTVKDIEGTIKHYLTKKSWHPDLLVVDYADNLAPLKTIKDSPRLEIFSIYRDLRALGQKHGFAVWTASQLNDEGTEASEEDDGVISVRHASEAKAKTHIADLIIAIGRSISEQQQGLARLQMVKNRLGRNDGTVVSIMTGYDRSLLWTNQQTGYVSPLGTPTAAPELPVADTTSSPDAVPVTEKSALDNVARWANRFDKAEAVLGSIDG